MRLPFTRRKNIPALPSPPQAPQDTGERLDAWVNRQTGLGTRESRTSCTYFEGRAHFSDEALECIYEYSGLVATVVDLVPDTALGKYFKVTELDDGQQVELEHYMMRLDAYAKLREAAAAARLYRGAVLFMQVIDGAASLKEPLDMSRINTVTSLQVFAGREVNVSEWNTEQSSRFFGEPEVYQISSEGASFEVHRSRLLHFDGTKSTRKAKRRGGRRGFGGSVVEQIWDAFQGYGTSIEYMNEAASRMSQGVLKLGGFNDGMKADSVESGKLARKLKMLLKSMSTMGDIVVDKETDDYSIVNRSLQGFADVIAANVDYVVASTRIPRSLLMQQQQAGIAQGDNSGDWKAWASVIEAERTLNLEPNVKRLLSIIFAAASSPVDIYGEFTITWPPVQEMTEAERATINLSKAQARSLDLTSGVVSTMEARQAEDVIETYHIEDYGTAQAPIDDIGG